MTKTDDRYAYTLCSLETGCAWRIYDVEGLMVASGLEPSQTDALAIVSQLISRNETPADRRASDKVFSREYSSNRD
jgi:hypothetical protein